MSGYGSNSRFVGAEGRGREAEGKNRIEESSYVRASWGAAVLRPYMIKLAGRSGWCRCVDEWWGLHLTTRTLRKLGCGTRTPMRLWWRTVGGYS